MINNLRYTMIMEDVYMFSVFQAQRFHLKASMLTESAGFLRLGRFWSCLARYSSIVVESVCPLGGIMWNYGLV